MLALVAAALFLLAAFNVSIGDVDLLLLGLAFWAAHFAVGHLVWPRRG